eukprot:TRINITY_DN3087_c0_g1_i1.p1 TRINITY_DN3087_c0_g1~~TRINITY_DN3087_c0_g1_i1.p1  ORF type:complete len:272 (-),score=74.46 TRINITY_DN3087_c0_g1_i1:139-888(-)
MDPKKDETISKDAIVEHALAKNEKVPDVLPNVPVTVDTVETNARYLAYFARYRSIITAMSRYLAFTSDVGEAFRPLVNPFFVRAAYGVSWAYVVGDVSYEGYKAWKVQKDPQTVGAIMLKRGLFQGIASMALPAFTIHTVVKQSSRFFVNSSPRLKLWGPTTLGLLTVPALPFMFDHPVEKALDVTWEYVEDNVFHKRDVKKTPALYPGDVKYNTDIASTVQQLKSEGVTAQEFKSETETKVPETKKDK